MKGPAGEGPNQTAWGGKGQSPSQRGSEGVGRGLCKRLGEGRGGRSLETAQVLVERRGAGGQPQGASFHARDRVFILMDILKNTDVLWIRDPKPKGSIRYALWVFPLGDQ